MDLLDRINNLQEKVRKTHAALDTEEATKNALIMPFISNVLGFDVFDPSEVIPEYTADSGVKKGEKVDYAIVKDGELTILLEAKKAGEPLTEKHGDQLFRYFSVTHARIAILTNGIEYRFFTDLEAPNKMDSKPYMVLDFSNFDESMIGEIKKLTKSNFDIENVISAAGELKYTRQIKTLIGNLYQQPSEEFVRMLAKQVHNGTVTSKVLEQFTEITKRAFKQLLDDKISATFNRAISPLQETVSSDGHSSEPEKTDDKPLIITTDEELQGFHLVKALVRDCIDATRVVGRDTQSYFGVLIDDNNRKPLCRLRFNAAQKYIGLLDEKNSEEKIPIETIDDIYKLADRLVERAKFLA